MADSVPPASFETLVRGDATSPYWKDVQDRLARAEAALDEIEANPSWVEDIIHRYRTGGE